MVVVGDREGIGDIFKGQRRPGVSGGEPAGDPHDGGVDEGEAVEAFDERHVVIGGAAEAEALDLHPEVAGEQFGRAVGDAEGLFELLEEDFFEGRLNGGQLSFSGGQFQGAAKEPQAPEERVVF